MKGKTKPKTAIQAIRFKKNKWTKQKSKKWIKEHNFNPIRLDETIHEYRYRIRQPSEFKSFRTLIEPNGINILLGIY
jgi:hypothetical protein